GMLARIERLERAENIAPLTTAPVASASARTVEAKEKAASTHSTEAVSNFKEAVVTPPVVEKQKASPAHGAFDIAALRRAWPDVIEDVKKRRRLTWSLLSASAQVLSVDENAITIGIVNAGAKESFERSESDVILRNAFIDVVGLDRKIAVVVDPSIDTNTPAARETRTSEAPNDPVQLTGAALLAKELGAKVIEGK
ncbi:MAG: DNA polymerase III subunit gamma/tau, partial [Acidobacteriota bacterium]|nr:DNA polymerase III subunit gamma/tau [Acidobacteriota bacterium]